MEKKSKLFWIDREILTEDRNYIGMFDLGKGLLMILIMLSHAFDHAGYLASYLHEQSDIVQLLFSPLSVLHYGTIPALFMICGYGVRKQPVKKCARQTLGMLFVPYICVIMFVTVGTLMKWMIAGGSIGARLRYQVLPFLLGYHAGERFFGNYLGDIGPLWFVVTYVLGCIYLSFINREKQTWLQIILLGVGSIVAMSASEIPLPFCIQQVFICTGFLYVGMWLKKYRIPQRKMPVYLLPVTYILCTFGYMVGGYVEFSINAFNRKANDVIIAYIAGVVFVGILYRLNVIQGRLAEGLRWIGRHMVWFCMIHTLSHVLVPWGTVIRKFNFGYLQGILFEFCMSFLYALTVCILLEHLTRRYMKKFYIKKEKKLDEKRIRKSDHGSDRF